MKNKEKLESLTKYLEAHPELRFWQGVLAWANEYYKDFLEKNYQVIEKTGFSKLSLDDDDTFYWE